MVVFVTFVTTAVRIIERVLVGAWICIIKRILRSALASFGTVQRGCRAKHVREQLDINFTCSCGI